MSLGTVISVSFSGLLAATLGWQMVFYVQGGMSLVFVVMWFALVYDSPAQHPWISAEEKQLIVGSENTSKKPAKVRPSTAHSLVQRIDNLITRVCVHRSVCLSVSIVLRI